MIKDDALIDALASVRAIVGESTPAATVVHDLALRGAQALQDDTARRQDLLNDLAKLSTSDAPPWDPDVLAQIDSLTAG